MKRGDMVALLPWALEEADLSFCHSPPGLGWDARAALAPLGDEITVCEDIDSLVRAVLRAAQPGDQVLCMSNGSFGGVHARLLAQLAARR
jgi:UDP-N-acetylmuramate: L-alanyl-gamma-D-glutamyl-meso-diaminopimelate ligase